MLESLDRIERFAPPESLPPEARLVWMAYHFAVLGRDAGTLSAECPEGPWRALAGAALWLAQDPFAIDPAPLEVSIEWDLPRIRAAVVAALARYASPPALK